MKGPGNRIPICGAEEMLTVFLMALKFLILEKSTRRKVNCSTNMKG